MPRMQVYLPDELYDEVKARGLPASELLQEAVRAEVQRLELLEHTDEYLEALVAEVGEPTAAEITRAEAIARRIREHGSARAS
jgi:post-segregation antitoxin (ccd killing protein)